MELILHVDGNNYKKLQEKLLADEVVNRASIKFKDAKQFGKEKGYLCIVSGTEERVEQAKKLSEDKEGNKIALEITGEEKEGILKKIKEEEDKAIEGFGGIFG